MELQNLEKNLEREHDLLKRYASHYAVLENERYRIMFYNRQTMFTILGIIIGWVLFSMSNRFIDNFTVSVFALFISFAVGIFGMRYVIGPRLDNKKQMEMKQASTIRYQPIIQEMNEINQLLEQNNTIPAKYRTVDATAKLLEYIQNKRIDSLKEGLNLYENEISRDRQTNRLNFMAEQNQRIIHNQKFMLKNQRKMINQQTLTNVLLFFR
ncbi:hypothetical protein [Sphingobacterium sp. CZ-2]|uniref:hypothetical protein n=1 Tax=Sphingobacterium sp. CZ-2 TaxID=2557994 RepID=UPI00106F8F39|nr:hypothetical protein [Sphingobacterium sp. CZ-2]QBR12814.1 hypothetical protein E3D81_11850 [Sphingobacterium sp. CZ-2]